MKKSIFVNAAIIALATLVSCQKEQFTENVTPVTGVTEFTATIEQPTKTVIAANGKVTWKAGDEIKVTDAASASAVYVAGSDGARTTFTLKEGETAVGTGPYTATYGDIDNQVYDAAGANCPLTAAETSTTTFKFSIPYAVVKITAESDGKEVIKSVDVNFGDKTYTLNCGEGVTLTSKGIDFFVAVNPAIYASLSVSFHTADKTATKVRKQTTTLAVKELLQVQFSFTEDDWESSEEDTPGALKGVFTVSDNGTPEDSSDDIKVRFSQGNLYCSRTSSETNDWTWHFYGKQYQFNSIPTTDGKRTAQTSDTEIDLFTWGYDNTSSNDSYSFNPVNTKGIAAHTTNENKQLVYNTDSGDDWGVAYCNSNNIAVGTWRTLSTAEWQYLFNTRTFDGGTKEGHSYQRAKINSDIDGGVYGMVLYPDNYTGTAKASYTSTEWTSLENAGCVFLPGAGYRCDGSNVDLVGGGNYWSSTAYNGSKAYIVCFDSRDVYPGTNGPRNYGYSVRLVTNVSAAPTPTPTEPEYVMMKMGTGVDAYTRKWATMNLGAEKVATDYKCYGDYYQWGSVEKLYTSITWTDNTTGSFVGLSTGGFAETNLTYNEDANLSDATNDVVMKTYPGTGWRMPTSQEFQDLYDACGGTYDKEKYASDACGESTEFTQGVYWCGNYDGVVGCLFVDEDGHKLFFPAAGDADGTDLLNAGSYGSYWSSSLDTSYTYYARYLYFMSDRVYPDYSSYRYGGYSVRPVSN